MELHEQYTSEVYDQLNYVATWLPTEKLSPGDVCTMHDNHLRVVSNLSEFEIPFEVEDTSVDTDIEYSSERAVSVQLKAKGDPPPVGSALVLEEAGIMLSFGRANAVLLRLAACTSQRIKSLHSVGERVLALHNAQKWPDGYVVIAQVIKAGASSIIISKGSDAAIALVAKGGVGAGLLTLASLDAGLQVKRESKIGAKFIAAPGLTPLAVTAGIQKRFLRDDRFRSPRPASASAPANAFGRVDYSDFRLEAQ